MLVKGATGANSDDKFGIMTNPDFRWVHFDGLVQNSTIPSALAMEIP